MPWSFRYFNVRLNEWECVSDKYSLRHANAFLNLKVFDTFFFFSLWSFICKFPNILLSLCFIGVSGDVTEKIEITLKIVIYSFILAFQNISHQRNMTFTYCLQFWADLFLSLLGGFHQKLVVVLVLVVSLELVHIFVQVVAFLMSALVVQ